ncbi:T9SS type A sorting domain-containing protein, partial [candidate division KSB1 bacterium]|nr:T9SS type A sorting domain-containing protein [candidate division KSB1 bacterium]
VITYSLSKPSHVELLVYNISGQKVQLLVNHSEKSGRHHVVFDAGELAAGLYFYRLKTGTATLTKKLLFLK